MHPDAILRALRHVWLTLQPLEFPMAVTGGLALAAWKHPRATRDVDLLLAFPRRDAAAALQRLEAAGVRLKTASPAVALGQLDLVQLLYEPPDTFIDVQVDLLLGDSDYIRQALARRVVMRLPGLDFDVAVLACEDLILVKLLSGRIIDRADAAALVRANRSTLDLTYLNGWGEKLDLRGALAEVWGEAFPGESPL